jgi:hypothetical protein
MEAKHLRNVLPGKQVPSVYNAIARFGDSDGDG